MGGAGFDFVWDDKTSAALRVLREAADLWATRGRGALQVTRVGAVFMQVLAWPQQGLWWMPRWPLRFFETGGKEPPSFVESCRVLAGGSTIEKCNEVAVALERCLGQAADLWAIGDPEQPNTRAQLQSMLELLWEKEIVPRPPSRRHPTGV
jgi:hypothetical protein